MTDPRILGTANLALRAVENLTAAVNRVADALEAQNAPANADADDPFVQAVCDWQDLRPQIEALPPDTQLPNTLLRRALENSRRFVRLLERGTLPDLEAQRARSVLDWYREQQLLALPSDADDVLEAERRYEARRDEQP